MYLFYQTLRHAKLRGYFGLRGRPFRSPDFQDFCLGQFGAGNGSATGHRSVNDAISLIFYLGLPGEMAFGYACFVPPTAGVSSVMSIGRRRAMGDFANEPVNAYRLSAVPNIAVSLPVSIERPRHAFVAFIGKNNINKIFRGVPIRHAPSDWITVPLPTAVVRYAKSA